MLTFGERSRSVFQSLQLRFNIKPQFDSLLQKARHFAQFRGAQLLSLQAPESATCLSSSLKQTQAWIRRRSGHWR
jgi:hypothetical protein